MNLFQKAKDLLAQPAQSPKEEALSFVLTDHFKGYKVLPVVVQGYAETEKNNKKMANAELSGHTIKFVPDTYDGNHKMFHVFVDDLKMGAIFDADNVKRVKNIEKVYAKMEEETIIGKKTVEKRTRIRVFIKEA